VKATNVNVSVIDGKTVTAVHEAGRTVAGQPVRVQAIAGGQYLLAEGEKVFAPENISLKRVGKDLHIALEGGDLDQPALIIEGFYEHEGQLVGMAEDSTYHAYVAVDGDDEAGAAFLIEGVPSAQALGGAELVGFGEGLGTLFGGIFTPLALGLGALGLIGAGLVIDAVRDDSNDKPLPLPEPEVPAQPQIGQILDNVGAAQGALVPGQVTDDTTPTFVGIGQPGDTVSVIDNGMPIGEVVVDEHGDWTFTPPPLDDGDHSFVVVVTNPAGTSSEPSVPFPVVIDTSAPVAPSLAAVTDDVGAVTGPIASGDTTDDNQPTLSGSGEVGSTITVIDNGSVMGSTLVDQQGQWTFTPADALTDGNHRFEIISTDPAGNVSAPSAEYLISVDTLAPARPALDSVFDDQGDRTGFLVTGETTDDAEPGLRGTAEAGSTVVILDKGVEIGRVQASASGEWTFTPTTPLSNGSHALSVQAIDAAGNASLPSASFDLNVVDGGAPAIPAITAVKDDVGSITGNLQKNDATDDNRPTLEGTAEAGCIITLYSNGILLGTTVTNAAGHWSFTPAIALADGPHLLTATATNDVGNISPATGTYPIIVDTAAPVPDDSAVLHDDVGALQGPIADGSTTDDNLPTFTGTAEANATVIIYANGLPIGEAVTDANGDWSFTPARPLADGPHRLVTEVVDAAGNVSVPSAEYVITVDTKAPVQPSIDEATDDVGTVTGPVASGGVTDDTQPTLSGSGEAGSTISVIDNGNPIGSTVVDEHGQWTFTPATALPEGDHRFEVISTDLAGNTSTPSAEYVITLDTTAPVKPTLDSVFDDQGDRTGFLGKGDVTDDAKPVLSGTAQAHSSVVILDNGMEIGRVQANASGDWTFTPIVPLSNASHSLSVQAIDAAGNASLPSDSFDFSVIAGGAPAMPVITALKDDVGSITGNLQKNDATDDNRPTLEGTAAAGSTITLYSNGNLLGSTVANATGQWSFTPATALADGPHSLTATATNSAGNISPATGIYPIIVDTVAPGMADSAVLHDDVGAIQGPITHGSVTDDNLPTFTGSAEANATLIIYDNGLKIGEARTNALGDWSFTPSLPLADGSHSFVTRVVDEAGNIGAQSTPLDFRVDTPLVEIAISQVVDNVGDIQGNLVSGSITDDATPTLNGTATPGGVVKLYDGATLMGETTANALGHWSFTPVVALAEGMRNLTATVTLLASGESTPTPVFNLIVDMTPPIADDSAELRDDVGLIQGVIGHGIFTDDNLPTFTGHAEPNATVVIYDNGLKIGEAKTSATGDWSFTPAWALAQGSHSFVTRVIDAAGNVGEKSVALDFEVDTRAVEITLSQVADNVGSLQGNLAHGDVTDDATPTLNGTATAGGLVKLYANGLLIGETTANALGNWSFTPAVALAEGPHALTATVTTGAAGESAPTSVFNLIVDTTAPSADDTAVLRDDVGSIQGVIDPGSTTDDNLPTFTGTAEPNAVVFVYDNGVKIAEVKTSATGDWSFTPALPLAEGDHSFVTKVIDAAGNVGEASTALDFRVDTRVLEVSLTQVLDNVGGKQGNLAHGEITDDANPTLSGKATAGGIVKLFANGVPIGQTTADPVGNWSFTPSVALADGMHNLTATVTTEAAGESAATSAFELTVDSIAPMAISIEAALDDVGSVQGSVANGAHTDDTTPTLSGQGEPGSLVTVYHAGDELGSVTVADDGTWTFTPSPLNEGEQVFSVISTDPAGNASVPSAEYVIIVDTVAPTISASVTSISNDSGFDSGDWLTNDGSAGRLMQGSLSAALAAHEIVQVSTDGGVTWVDAVVSGLVWSAVDNNDHVGNWQIQARVIDSAGLVGRESVQDVLLDTTPPGAPTVVSASGNDITVRFNAMDVSVGDWITVINGAERVDHQVLQADIDAAKVVIGLASAPELDLRAVIVDPAGNVSLDTTLFGTVIEEFNQPPATGLSGIETAFGSITCEKGVMSVGVHPGAGGSTTPMPGNLTVGEETNPANNDVIRFDLKGPASSVTVRMSGDDGGSNFLSFFAADGSLLGGIILTGNHASYGDYVFQPVPGALIAYFKYSSKGESSGVAFDSITVDFAPPGEAVREGLLADQSGLTATDGEAHALNLSLADVLDQGGETLFSDADDVQWAVNAECGDRLALGDLLGAGVSDPGQWNVSGPSTQHGVSVPTSAPAGVIAEALIEEGVQVNPV